MTDRPHALASPSKAAMWLVCANSLAANEGQPEGDRKAADLGTDKHELMTLCLEFYEDAVSYLGQPLGRGHTVTKELAHDVQTVVDNVRERIRGYELRGCTVVLELDKAVPIEHITGESAATGTLDVALVVSWPDGHVSIDVIDAKFGYYEVTAEENPQLLMYASGELEEYALVEDVSRVTEVNLVIEQPLRGTTDWSTTPEWIAEWVDEAKRKAELALDIYYDRIDSPESPESPFMAQHFTVSEKGCMWCKAKAVCPALTKHVESTIEADFESFTEAVASDSVPLLEVSELAGKFEALEIIEDWINAVRARVELELLAGKQIPGLKLVAGKKGNRAWASDDEAEALMKKFKLKQDQMYSLKLLGPKPILDALKDSPRRLKQIEQLVIQPQGKPHVALDSDKRPALEIKPVEDGFETVDEGEDLC